MQSPQRASPPGGRTSLPPAPAWYAVARGVAFFWGLLSLITAWGELYTPLGEADFGWIDLHPVPLPAARGFLALAGMLLLVFAVRPGGLGPLRWVVLVIGLIVFGITLENTVQFYAALRRGHIQTDVPLPVSLHVGACFAVALGALVGEARVSRHPRRDFLLAAGAGILCAVTFPLAEIYCFGRVHHLRSAEAAVVFGPRTARDSEQPSPVEAGLRTALRLHREGRVQRILLARPGGSTDSGEFDALGRQLDAGRLSRDELTLLPNCTSHRETAERAAAELRNADRRRILAVGPFHELPRIRLCCRRAGLQSGTVPVADGRSAVPLPPSVAREMITLWGERLRQVTGRR